LDSEIGAAMVDEPALPELPDHCNRLTEHGLADIDRRPALTYDVLVEVFATAQAEEETARHEGGDRRCCLGDDRGMDADDGTGHAGADVDGAGLHRDGAEHTPDEGAFTLDIEPGMEVVGNHRYLEAGSFCPHGQTDQ